MLKGGDSSVIQRALLKEFDAGWIIGGYGYYVPEYKHSGKMDTFRHHIPQKFKNTISSYRLLGRHTPALGQGKIDFLQIKLVPGMRLSFSEKKSASSFC